MTFEGTLFNPLYLKSNFCSYFDAHLFIFNLFMSIMKLGSWYIYHFGPAYFIWYCEFVLWHWLIIYTLHFQCTKLIQPILSWWICCYIALSFFAITNEVMKNFLVYKSLDASVIVSMMWSPMLHMELLGPRVYIFSKIFSNIQLTPFDILNGV